MAANFDPGPLLGHSYVLDDGFRVRLRMARSSDLTPIRDLLERRRDGGEVELERLVQFDPRRRCVICASALIDSAETLIGVGSIDLDDQGDAGPDVLLVDGDHADAVAALLTAELIARADYFGEADAA